MIGDPLPERVAMLATHWGLVLDERFPGTPGSQDNFVAPAVRADGTRCVLKVSPHVRETRAEITALTIWNGAGAAQLLAAEPDLGGILIERIEPGTMLSETAALDDDAATRIAADVLRKLWRPFEAAAERPIASQGAAGPIASEVTAGLVASEAAAGLVSLESWCAAYARNRGLLSRGVAGFPAQLFQRADTVRAELLASTDKPAVLHGDLHHFNVLYSDRANWLAIDPKGLVGDRCFDVCQFLRNPRPVPASVNSRRLDVFCAELGLDAYRTRQWCLVHAVLDACWSFEHGGLWQSKVEYAEQTLLF